MKKYIAGTINLSLVVEEDFSQEDFEKELIESMDNIQFSKLSVSLIEQNLWRVVNCPLSSYANSEGILSSIYSGKIMAYTRGVALEKAKLFNGNIEKITDLHINKYEI